MVTQMMSNKNKNTTNIKRAAQIVYLLKISNLKQKDVAQKLNVKPQVINNFINGRIKSRRIANWFKENLGI